MANLPNVRTITFSGCVVSEAVAGQLVSLDQVRTLRFHRVNIAKDVYRAFRRMSFIENLEYANYVTTRFDANLIESFLPLKELSVEFSLVDLEGLGSLHLETVEYLSLRNSHIVGASALGSAKTLRTLILRDTDVTDDQLKLLVGLEALVSLDLSGTTITDSSTNLLLQLTNLRSLNIMGTQLSLGAITRLNQALSDCDIYSDWGMKRGDSPVETD